MELHEHHAAIGPEHPHDLVHVSEFPAGSIKAGWSRTKVEILTHKEVICLREVTPASEYSVP